MTINNIPINMIYIFLIFFNFLFNSCWIDNSNTNEISILSNDFQDKIGDIYKKAELKGIVNFEIFKMAMTGYYQLNQRKKNIITIIDYSEPSTKERFFVIDIDNK